MLKLIRLTVGLLGAVACSGEPVSPVATLTSTSPPGVSQPAIPAPTSDHVDITLGATALVVGQAKQASASLRDAAGNDIAYGDDVLIWSTPDSAVVTISKSGLVVAIAVGTATITVAAQNKTAATTVTVLSAPAAVVLVAVDSANLTVPHEAHATASLLDAAGHPTSGAVRWSSSDSTIARVSATGEITAIAAGAVTVTAGHGSASASVDVTINQPVITAPTGPSILATNDFEGGTLGPYTDPWRMDTDIVDDPTGSGRHGKVVRIHYKGFNQDRNRGIMFEYPKGIGLGQTIFFKGDVYLPADIDGNVPIQRKLLYWQAADQTTFPTFQSILTLYGLNMAALDPVLPPNGVVNMQQASGLTMLHGGRWYTIERQTTMNSSFSARDGIDRVWVDGVLIYENTSATWSDPKWTAHPAKQKFRYFIIGDQANAYNIAYDEYRYWDNISFGTSRIP